jgi:hypothetical protein
MKRGARRFLAREFVSGTQFRVYQRDDALEVDELTYSEGERARVYFDDVLLLTYHRRYGTAFLVFTAIFGLLFVSIALAFLFSSDADARNVGGTLFLVLAAPFVTSFILRLIFRVDVITVYGRRTFARMNFHWRKARARQVYAELSEKIAASQAELARAQADAAPKPAPAPEPPPPPPHELGPGLTPGGVSQG